MKCKLIFWNWWFFCPVLSISKPEEVLCKMRSLCPACFLDLPGPVDQHVARPSCAQMSSRVRRCAVQEPTVGFWIPKVRECMWKAIVSILSSECPPPWWHYLQEAVATPPASSSCPKCKCLAARLLQRIVKVAKRCAGRTLQTCSYSSAWMCLCASGKVRIKIGDLGWAESLGFILSWWIWWESIPEQSTMSTSAQILDQLGCDEHCWLLLCEGPSKGTPVRVSRIPDQHDGHWLREVLCILILLCIRHNIKSEATSLAHLSTMRVIQAIYFDSDCLLHWSALQVHHHIVGFQIAIAAYVELSNAGLDVSMAKPARNWACCKTTSPGWTKCKEKFQRCIFDYFCIYI